MLRYSYINIPYNDAVGEQDVGEQFLEKFGDVVLSRDCVVTRATRISNAGVLTVGSSIEVGKTMVMDFDFHGKNAQLFELFDKTGEFRYFDALKCPFAFVEEGKPLDDDFRKRTKAVGQMDIIGDVWVLYRRVER